jgi:hypothetical protein
MNRKRSAKLNLCVFYYLPTIQPTVYRILLLHGLVVFVWRDIWSGTLEVLASYAPDGRMLVSTRDMTAFMAARMGGGRGDGDRGDKPGGRTRESNIEMMNWKYDNPYAKEKRGEGNNYSLGISCAKEELERNSDGDRRPVDTDIIEAYVGQKLFESVRAFDMSMYYYFLLACLVNIPWIVSLFFFKDRLTYQPDNGQDA